MSWRCDLTGKDIQTGNNVSHSHRKTRRRFYPNLQQVTLRSDVLNQDFRFKIAVSTLRSIEINGGLDGFLTSRANANLSDTAQKLKRTIKKTQQATAA